MALLSADGAAPQHQAAMLLGAKCRRCPLYNRGEGPVMGQIRRGAKLAVVGEAPSSRDVEEGAPFVGQHGEIMAGAFAEGGVTKSDCTLTHAILCRPPGGSLIQYLVEFRRQQRKLAPSERLLDPRDACFPRLQMELAANDNVRTVLGMGNEGLRAVAQVYDVPFGSAKAEPGAPRLSSVTKQHGSPVQLVRPDGRDLTVMASLQPSFALHGKPEYMPVVRADLARVAEVSQRGGLTLWREPEFILDPTLDVAINLIDLLRQSKQLVTVDIETDSVSLLTAAVRCVGLGAEINGHEIVGVIPLERMQTRLPWWGAGAMTQVQNALRALLDEAPLNGHNLMFDTAVLICRGLMRRRDKLWADCYRERDTEFLTERGWLAYADVRPTDRLATVRPDGSMEFQHYTDRVSKIHHGVLYQIETHHTRAVVTPRHRMWTRPVKRGAHGATVGAWGFTEMRDLLVQSPDTADMLRACPPAPEADQPNPVVDGIELTPSLLKFLGLAISDGSIRWYKEAPYRLRVSQLEEGRAAPLLKTLHEELQLQRNGPYVKRASATRRVDAREMRWTHPSRELAAAFVRWIGRYSVERRLPPFTLTLPVKHRQALLAGLLVGDASPIGKQITYRSAHKALADDVQALALSLGLPTNVLRASSDCWGAMIQIGQPAVVRARMRTTDVDSNGVVTEIPGEGERIACFVVPNHTLVTRSGGRPAFHGNTLIGHHDTRWSELPHNLGFVAARYFDSPRWKEDADSKVVKGVADYWLHKYCGRDVLNTHRLWPRIAAQIEADGQMGAYSTDIRMAPGLRDMGLLGLNINEQRRQEYFQTFTRAALRHRENVRRIVGNPDFNPSAARQVARFLFDEQGLTPTYASGGVEWEELIQENEDEELDLDLEDLETVVVKASTDETALLALIERGVDAKSREFIDAELSFRAMLKTHTALGLKLEADGSQTDTYRAKGHLHTRSFNGPGLQKLSILNPNWKVHVTPSGRLASSPAVQNIAERVVFDVEQYRATDGKQGIINLRTIFEAPPGYIYVGADYSQIELRLVAAKAKDALLLEALAKGLDPHALNYGSMMARSSADLMREYEKVVNAPPKVKKHLRNIAKRLCIAEDEPVLVRRDGQPCEVPIQDVAGSDEVWDGVEWVRHDGVVLMGVREVIEHDGLWATEDHEVWLATGERVTHGAGAGRPLLRSGEAGRPLRVVADHGPEREDEGALEGSGVLHRLQTPRDGLLGELARGEVVGLRLMSAPTDGGAALVARPYVCCIPAMHEPESSGLEGLRGARDSVRLPLDSGGRGVCHGNDRPAEGAGDRPDRHEQPLHAGEPALGDRAPAAHESALHEAPGRLGLSAGGMAADEEGGRTEAPARHDAGADPAGGAGVRGTSGELASPRRRTARVYDLVNAGPRHRFTVRGRLVSNCFLIFYGGHKTKLAKTMKSDRNPDGSLSFPGLKDSDVFFWYDNFHKQHPEILRWQQDTIAYWQTNGFVETVLDGRRRYFVGGEDMTAIPNMRIQGSAAAIANRALLLLMRDCPYQGWGELAGPVFQCHDELVLQVPIERTKDAEELIHAHLPWTDPADGMYYAIEQSTRKTLAGG